MTVAEIQRALIARGYDLGKGGPSKKGDDGDAGPKTIAAVMAFQRAAGLVVDGIAGPRTQLALRKNEVTERRSEPKQPGWLVLASAMHGVREGAGALNNAIVVKLFADAGFPGIKTDSTAWCAAYVNAMLERAGHRGSRSLAARSFESWGVGLREPVLGCIATKRRGNSSWQGHCFFVVGATSSQVFGLGGNQDNMVNVAPFDRDEIVGLRWPADVPIPIASDLPKTIAGARSITSEA